MHDIKHINRHSVSEEKKTNSTLYVAPVAVFKTENNMHVKLVCYLKFKLWFLYLRILLKRQLN